MAAEDLISEVESAGVVRILNCLPSVATENDWTVRSAVNSGLLAAVDAIPGTVDRRDDTWWRIGDQGSTGSCVGWALADSVLRWHFTESGRVQRDELLSPRFLWMGAKETDEFTSEPSTFIERAGTSLKAALQVARQYGAVRDSTLPFGSGTLFDGDVNSFYATASQLKITAYFNLGRGASDWRQWLASNGPILTRLSVDRTWDQASQTRGKLDTYLPETARGGHAVALVGYTPDRFIVRNSWGTNWGDRGYAYVTPSYAVTAFTEAYGVTTLPGEGPRTTPGSRPTPGRRGVWHR
jgi:hypothetical protein